MKIKSKATHFPFGNW